MCDLEDTAQVNSDKIESSVIFRIDNEICPKICVEIR